MLASVALRAARSGSQAPIGVALAALDRLSSGYATAATVSASPEPSASGAVDLAALRERLASGTLCHACPNGGALSKRSSFPWRTMMQATCVP